MVRGLFACASSITHVSGLCRIRVHATLRERELVGDHGPADAAPEVACLLTAEPVAGAFALPETLKRSHLRTDLSTGARKDGVPLRLKLTFHRVDGGARTPLAGHHLSRLVSEPGHAPAFPAADRG